MRSEATSTCQTCGARVPARLDFCPVCAFRRVLDEAHEASQLSVDLSRSSATSRFDHYEILTREDGTPFELGRGAMGVTYKAVDVNLRSVVALKVISTRWVSDGSARRRFVREARAAASVRHPNVASVFYLGNNDDGYFYAMEFVDGDTLAEVQRRLGKLDVHLVLDIATQIASGLAAIHDRNLVHRDLKQSNIMVDFKDGECSSVKIIDLGLAKAVGESVSADISLPGAFVGTPEFASPEQFTGGRVDIRSDLYSLGVVLWKMLTDKVPFSGTVTEVMYQHLHKPPPIEQLRGLPTCMVVLVKRLLHKNQAKRFQAPADLLTALTKASKEAGLTDERQSLKGRPIARLGPQAFEPFVRKGRKRSVAVLPFETVSDGASNTYFADGVHDEVLSSIAKVSQLKVISRTSVMGFRRSRSQDLRSIAKVLGVTNVVEGTVRRAGNHVRITIRLVNAKTDETLWSESYDRDLIDIFAIQSDVAQRIAEKLAAKLSAKERKRIEARPTANLAAYDLYLRARSLLTSFEVSAQVGNIEGLLNDAISLLDQAIWIDPKFTLAYCECVQAHDLLFLLYERTAERRALADAALQNTHSDLPEVHKAWASHLFRCYEDYEKARTHLSVAKHGLPNDSEVMTLEALIDRRQGRFEKAIGKLNESITRDPLNVTPVLTLADTLVATRQFDLSEEAYDRAVNLSPDNPLLKIRKAYQSTFRRDGDREAVRLTIAAVPPSMCAYKSIKFFRLALAFDDGNWPEAKRLIQEINDGDDDGEFAYGQAPVPIGCYSILLARLKGEKLISTFVKVRKQLSEKANKSPANGHLLSQLAVVDALLRDYEVANAEARRAAELLPISADAMGGPGIRTNLAVVYSWTNQLDLAFETLRALTIVPNGIYYGQLKYGPYWYPLRQDPRFEKVLAQLAPNQSLLMPPSSASRSITHKPSIRSTPEKISVARLPVTGSDLFGREEDLAFLDRAWANQDVNVVTIVAWAGVGKSTLVNHWLRRMATEHYRSAELVFGWSFYRQGSSGDTSSADKFLDAALNWFGDPDPRLGTDWEKGERLAKLVAHRRTLLVLDGLEPLQNPPGPQEGRLREPSLQALLRELAAFNTGLCVITTRTPVADIADHEHTSAPHRELEQLSSEAGAKLLRSLSVKGHEAELRTASGEFGGHCLALTLLGSYLTDAYHGDIRRREEVSAHLAQDLRQGTHARKVMESYQAWFGEGPELSILRMLGLFDRPAQEQTFGALLKSPAIPGLTESLTDLRPTEWQTFLAKLRRARLLAQEDPHNPGQLDTHPLIREYFGEQLRSQQTDAWKECNRRLFYYYQTLAPQLPNSFREMEPLFLAVICGCNADLFHEALHEVYLPRIQRGNAAFAAKVLGARGVLLSVLAHFFEHGDCGSPVQRGAGGQSLKAEDELLILAQAGVHLTAMRGFGAPEVRICYERVEALCVSLHRPLLLYSALMGQWLFSLVTGKLTATMQIAKRVYSLAQEQNDAALMVGAYRALAGTLYYLGDFGSAREYAGRGVVIWRSGGVPFPVEEITAPAVSCLFFEALSEWHLGGIASSRATMAEAISLAKELNDTHALAIALFYAAILAHFERNPAEVARLASNLIELSTRHNFAYWLAGGEILRGWARSASGDTAEGISRIEDGIRDWLPTGAILVVPYYLALKAEALHLADRTSEALEAITEAEAMVERSEERWWCAELHRLRGVFLTALGAEETQIEASFCEAIRIAKEQKSVSLAKRGEATYAEYRRQKASAAEGRGFRLPI